MPVPVGGRRLYETHNSALGSDVDLMVAGTLANAEKQGRIGSLMPAELPATLPVAQLATSREGNGWSLAPAFMQRRDGSVFVRSGSRGESAAPATTQEPWRTLTRWEPGRR